MILALDVTIEKSSSIVDVYDQIFSVNGGSIYSRCYDAEHRINKPEIKESIYRISQEIAFWIFENNADKAFIPQKMFEDICDDEMKRTKKIKGEEKRESIKKREEMQKNALIWNYFKLIKHCEGVNSEELHFVHRSIYEYFVTVYFFESIYQLESPTQIAGEAGRLLKDGNLSKQILEFIKYKFDSIGKGDLSDITRGILNVMLRDGMVFHMGTPLSFTMVREMNIFANMLEIVHLWNPMLGKVDDGIISCLMCNRNKSLMLEGIILAGTNLERVDFRAANLSKADLRKVNLEKADLTGAYLIKADLREARLIGAFLDRTTSQEVNLTKADLSKANLIKVELSGMDLEEVDLVGTKLINANLREAKLNNANLSSAELNGADLRGAELYGTEMSGAYLRNAIFDEMQVNLLNRTYDLRSSRVYIAMTGETIGYEEYCARKGVKIDFYKNLNLQ